MNTWVAGHELDAYWADCRLAVEIDGATHRTRQAFQRDRQRDRALASQGIRVVRATSLDLQDQARLAKELKEVRRASRDSSAAA